MSLSMNRVTKSVPDMDKEPTYISRRILKANDRGWGKYHLIKTGEKLTLCSVKLRNPAEPRSGRTIERALKFLEFRLKRQRSKSHQACKSCLARAQKHRNPLDRLADLDA